MPRREPCELCGADDARPRHVGLAFGPMGYAAVVRCVDHVACRERCDAAGRFYPTNDR